jgi:hypothetical protein
MPLNETSDLTELVPELNAWNDGKGIDIDTWISCEGDHKHLIGYARILWPQFIEHEDCIFLGDEIQVKNYQEWLAHTQGDKARVEKVMNHRHIVDLFSRSHHEPPTREAVLYLGRLMKEIWQTKLTRDFPNRRIAVIFLETGVEDILDYQITFFQER